MGFHPGDDRSSDSGGHRHHRILVGLNQPLIECARSQWAATCGRTLLPARFNVDPRRTSGLSGLSRGGRPSLARVLPSNGDGPRLVTRLRGRCAWRASAKAEGGGGPNGPERPADTGRGRAGPVCRMRAIHCAISGGTRRSPHHRCPQAASGYIDCQRAPNSSVPRGTVMQHSQLVGPPGPSHLHGHYGSERALETRLEGALGAQGSRGIEAARSTLGSTSLRTHAAACRRFPRQRASSNGWPVCMIIRSSGTSFRAMVQTALVPGTPRARIASYSGR